MIILVYHQKGGVGKSTTVWNLAITLQKYVSKEIVVLDLDIQKTLTYTNIIRENNGLTPLSVMRAETKEDLIKYAKSDHEDRISIIDAGGFDAEISRAAIVLADFIITPVSDRNFELLGIKSFEEILKQISEAIGDTVKVKVLLNNISPQKSKLKDLKKHIKKSKHFELLESMLRSRVDFDKSVGLGMGAIEYDKSSKASKEMKKLTKEILEYIS